jgi:hypothetical protein
MKKLIYFTLLCVFIALAALSCKKNDDTPTTGSLKGTVTNSSNSQAISGARIIVYDANTNAPTENLVLSGSDGKYAINLSPGTYYLNLGKQGFNGIPAAGITPVSVTVEAGKEVINDFQMQPTSITNGGYITGKVTSNGNALPNVLVVAGNGSTGYSSVSAKDGSYIIYNVPAGSYQVQGYSSDYSSPVLNATVTANAESAGNNIAMTSGVSGSVSGTVTFLATNNGEVDVTLTNPFTKETIPGLVTKTLAGIYSIGKVPNGTYIVRASFSNDSYVVDPDWILRNGEPKVTVSGSSVSQNFSVTGAVRLVSPTNDSTTTKPIVISSLTPTFTWTAYSSTADYVIEVSDINGNVIWGGFTKGTAITKNIIIPKSQLSIIFNSDGKATKSLVANTIYRWRIYSSKNDVSSPTGWKLISVSEDQRGLFIIK